MQIYQNVSKISFFVMFFGAYNPLFLQGMTIGREDSALELPFG